MQQKKDLHNTYVERSTKQVGFRTKTNCIYQAEIFKSPSATAKQLLQDFVLQSVGD